MIWLWAAALSLALSWFGAGRVRARGEWPHDAWYDGPEGGAL